MRIAIIVALQIMATDACFAFDKVMVREECKAQWKGDYVMQQYCIDRETEAGKKVDEIDQENSTGTTESEILEKCRGEWPRAYVMVAYCYDRQIEAFKALQ